MLQSVAIPPGVGTSHFCEALGQLAIDAGRTVAWFAIDELGALVRRHRADDKVTRAIARITRADLIVVDDIGMPRSAWTSPRASTGWSTPPTSGAPWPCPPTCTRPGSTS
jgi:YD repeat-containing protein